MDDALMKVEQVGDGLLHRATTPSVLAPLQLPVIEQVFSDIFDERYPLGPFSQIRWLKGRALKRRWRDRVDETYERMGVAVLEAMVRLTEFQVGQLQRELQHAEDLRFIAERQALYNRQALESQFALMGEQHRLARSQSMLQAQIDQAAEKLRQDFSLTAGREARRHEVTMENQRLFNDLQRITTQAQLRPTPSQATAEGIAAFQHVWKEMERINLLEDEDEKHRRLQMLRAALPHLLRFDGPI